MIDLLRWVIALPLGLLASFATFIVLGFIFSIGQSFDEVDRFWESPDMAGMPIIGSYILFSTRTATILALIGVTAGTVPKFKKQTAIALAVVVTTISLAFLCYLLYQSININASLGFGVWYRNILEMISILGGCVVGVALFSGTENVNGHA